MSTLTQPRGQIAIGWAVVGGQRVPVVCDPEWIKFFTGLSDRVGGPTGLSTTDVDAGSYAAMQPLVQDAGHADTLQTMSVAFVDVDMLQPMFLVGDAAAEVSMPDAASIAASYEVMQFDCMQISDVFPMQE